MIHRVRYAAGRDNDRRSNRRRIAHGISDRWRHAGADFGATIRTYHAAIERQARRGKTHGSRTDIVVACRLIKRPATFAATDQEKALAGERFMARDHFDLGGKIAVDAGASRGIGQAIAVILGEMAAAVLYLVCDASSYTTDTSIVVDGGYFA